MAEMALWEEKQKEPMAAMTIMVEKKKPCAGQRR